jgi:hypothetical protein
MEAPPKKIIYKEIDGNLVAVDIDGAKYYTFNHTATKMFNYLREGLRHEEVTSKISAEFGVPVESAQADLEQLLNDLESKHLPIK